jgi:hypothetical protein
MKIRYSSTLIAALMAVSPLVTSGVVHAADTTASQTQAKPTTTQQTLTTGATATASPQTPVTYRGNGSENYPFTVNLVNKTSVLEVDKNTAIKDAFSNNNMAKMFEAVSDSGEKLDVKVNKVSVVNVGSEATATAGKMYAVKINATVSGLTPQYYYNVGLKPESQYKDGNVTFDDVAFVLVANKTSKVTPLNKTTKKIMHASYVYDEDGKRANDVTLPSYSTVKVTGYMSIKGKGYYQIGKNKFIKASNVDGTVKVANKAGNFYNTHGKKLKTKFGKAQVVVAYGGSMKCGSQKVYRVAEGTYVRVADLG